MSSDVRRPKEYEKMLYDLCQSEKRIFTSYKDALVFAASIGFDRKEIISFEKSSEPIKMHIFSDEFDVAFMNCIGLMETKDATIMGDAREQEKVTLFEQYAAAGLEVIRTQIYESGKDFNIAVLEIINTRCAPSDTILENITNLAT